MRHKGSYVKESLSAIYLANHDGEEDVGEKIQKRSEYAYANEILRMETRDGRDWTAPKLSYCNIKRVWGMGRRRNSKGHIQKKAR